jgi:carbamoyl-phosphate synthase large subunit
MKFNVLVTGTSSYGVGEGLIKLISDSAYKEQINLIGASNSKLTAFKDKLKSYYVLPNANHPTYIDEIKNVIKNERVNILIPGSEAEMIFFSQNKKGLEKELEVDIWVNDFKIINAFDNKLNADEFFNRHEINTPRSYQNRTDNFPLIIKPVQGKSSEGIFIIKNNETFQAVHDLYKVLNIEIIVQEFLEKEAEFTVSLINLGDRLEMLTMERILNKGATQYAKIVDNSKIEDICRKVHSVIGTELILNLQILKKDNEFYVFEINPRFSGSAPMRAKLGYNEFDILFAHKYLNKVHVYELKKDSYCIRGYEEVTYID